MTDQQTDLIVVHALNAATVFADGGAGVDDVIEKIRSEVRGVKLDISTPAGRALVKSTAFKVARSKTALDELGKNLVADLKRQTGAVDAERKRIREALDELRDQVRAPLTAWEDAEKRRVDGHEEALVLMQAIGVFRDASEASVADIDARIARLDALPERNWQEFVQRATDVRAEVVAFLATSRAHAVRREADRAELERLRADQLERAKREHEAKIAAEAAEAARLEAEERAARLAREEADRVAAERREVEERAERDRAAAEANTRRMERETREAQERAEQAERDRLTSEEAARLAAAEAEREAVRREEAAREAERRRAAEEREREAAEAAQREADKRHRAKIHGEAAAVVRTLGIDKNDAARLVDAIADGAVPHVSIAY